MAYITCNKCSNEVSDQAKFCPHCGALVEKNQPREVFDHSEDPFDARPPQSMTPAAPTSSLGIWAFVLSLLSLFLPLVIVDIVLGATAFILAMIVITQNKSYKGLAIAGLVISILAVTGAITMLASLEEFTWIYPS